VVPREEIVDGDEDVDFLGGGGDGGRRASAPSSIASLMVIIMGDGGIRTSSRLCGGTGGG
jgi:hypothetical protein